jgi:metaxin
MRLARGAASWRPPCEQLKDNRRERPILVHHREAVPISIVELEKELRFWWHIPWRPMNAGPSTPRLRLLQYETAWGAPSLDVQCSKAQAWLRVCGCAFEVESARDGQTPWSTQLPVLRDGAQAFEQGELYAHLRSLGIDADAALSADERAESAAWQALIEERLGVSMLHAFWAEDDNYNAVLRPAYAARLPVPLNLYLPWMMRKRVLSQLARRGALRDGVAYRIGCDALDALSQRLAGRSSFFSAGPSGVDACAFAYLDTLLRCPAPRDALRAKLRSLPALAAFIETFSVSYFGSFAPLEPTPETDPRLRPQPLTGRPTDFPYAWAPEPGASPAADARSARTPKQQRFKRRSRNAVLGAIGAALVYAFATDMVGGSEEYEEYESEED